MARPWRRIENERELRRSGQLIEKSSLCQAEWQLLSLSAEKSPRVSTDPSYNRAATSAASTVKSGDALLSVVTAFVVTHYIATTAETSLRHLVQVEKSCSFL